MIDTPVTVPPMTYARYPFGNRRIVALAKWQYALAQIMVAAPMGTRKRLAAEAAQMHDRDLRGRTMTRRELDNYARDLLDSCERIAKWGAAVRVVPGPAPKPGQPYNPNSHAPCVVAQFYTGRPEVMYTFRRPYIRPRPSAGTAEA